MRSAVGPDFVVTPGCLRAQAFEAERVERIRLIEIARLDDLQVLKPILVSALSFLSFPHCDLLSADWEARCFPADSPVT